MTVYKAGDLTAEWVVNLYLYGDTTMPPSLETDSLIRNTGDYGDSAPKLKALRCMARLARVVIPGLPHHRQGRVPGPIASTRSAEARATGAGPACARWRPQRWRYGCRACAGALSGFRTLPIGRARCGNNRAAACCGKRRPAARQSQISRRYRTQDATSS